MHACMHREAKKEQWWKAATTSAFVTMQETTTCMEKEKRPCMFKIHTKDGTKDSLNLFIFMWIETSARSNRYKKCMQRMSSAF